LSARVAHDDLPQKKGILFNAFGDHLKTHLWLDAYLALMLKIDKKIIKPNTKKGTPCLLKK
tara:strand:+ start:15672 stop:15854 length:183 start_codon:yes stop_codon:yes gene_type:complete